MNLRRPKQPTIRTGILTTALITASALLTACGGSTGQDSGAGSKPRPGGTLTFAFGADPACFDPGQVPQNTGLSTARGVVDSLTDQDPKTGKIVPWLAKSWDINRDATAFTFHLRTDATFSDGSPVNAAAVKATFDGIHELGAKAYLGPTYLDGYKSTTVDDAHTVTVRFSEPNVQFLQASSTMTLGILAPASFKKTPEQRCQGDYIGSGPFTFTSYAKNDKVVLSKRKGYNWPSKLWGHTGEAYLDKVEIRFVAEDGTRTGSLLSGQVDGALPIPPQDRERVESGGAQVVARTNPGLTGVILPNEQSPLLSDSDVRRAIQQGINRDEYTKAAFSDDYKPATSIISSVTPGHADQSDELAYDPAGARKLLDAAGWKTGSDGIRVKNGKRLAPVFILTQASQQQGSYDIVQQQLKKIGVDLRLKTLTDAQLDSARKAGTYDLMSWSMTRAEADVLRTVLSADATNNFARREPGSLEKLFAQEIATTDETKRAALLADIQHTIVTDADAFPLNEAQQVFGLSAKAHGVKFEASSRLTFYDAWVTG